MTVKNLVIAMMLVTVVAAPAAAQMDAGKDRAAAITHLEMTRAKFLKSVEGLTDAQWTFKPALDRWSIAEVAEHIAISRA